jgi:hypothetical protein
MIRILSHGGGVQTTVEALMHASGELPPIDAAIFADTQQEPKAMYRQLHWLSAEVAASKYPFPFYRVTKGDLWPSASMVRTSRDGQRRYIKTSIPLHFVNGDGKPGRGMRGCTTDFKIEIIIAKARALIGRRRKRIKESDGVMVEMLLGFTVDEVYRMKDNPEPWIRNRFMLIEAGMSRADCYAWAEKRGYPELVGSACKFCPHRTDWAILEPDELQECIDREPIIQAAYAQTNIEGVPYFHISRVPLSQVKHSAVRKRKMAEEQMNMFINSNCQGGCGV